MHVNNPLFEPIENCVKYLQYRKILQFHCWISSVDPCSELEKILPVLYKH